MSDVWTLIYATDSQGNQVTGNLAELRRAVIAGADVKVIYNSQADIWWSRNCSSIQVSQPGGNILVAAIFMEAADTSSTGIGIDFDTPFALEYHIYNSTGVRSIIKFDYQNHTKISSNNRNIIPMKWYVKDYEEESRFSKIRDWTVKVFSRR